MYVCRSRLSQDIDCSLCFALQTCNSGIEIGTRYKNQFKYKYKQKYTNTNINRDKIIQHVDWNLNLFQGDWELKDRKSMQQEDKAPRLGISNVILILLFVSTTYYFQIARRQCCLATRLYPHWNQRFPNQSDEHCWWKYRHAKTSIINRSFDIHNLNHL